MVQHQRNKLSTSFLAKSTLLLSLCSIINYFVVLPFAARTNREDSIPLQYEITSLLNITLGRSAGGEHEADSSAGDKTGGLRSQHIVITKFSNTTTKSSQEMLPREIVDDNDRNNYHQKQQGSRSEEEVKIVAFTDFTFLPLATEWYTRMTNLGYKTHTLVAIDQESMDFLLEMNKNSSDRRSQLTYRVELQLVNKGGRRKEMVGNLWYNRLVYCLRLLKNGVSLLLTDTDNIFMRYEPTSKFQDSGYDAIFAFERGYPPRFFKELGFVVCGGMMYLKSTNSTIQVLERVIETCSYGGTRFMCNDQVEWNKFVAHEMQWFANESKAQPNEQGYLKYGFEGISKSVQGFKCKIWDRDFAWRGDFESDCPSEKNWVAMPLDPPHWVTQMYVKAFGRDIAVKKLVRNKVFEKFCGKNGTYHQDKNTNRSTSSINDKLEKAVQAILLDPGAVKNK